MQFLRKMILKLFRGNVLDTHDSAGNSPDDTNTSDDSSLAGESSEEHDVQEVNDEPEISLGGLEDISDSASDEENPESAEASDQAQFGEVDLSPYKPSYEAEPLVEADEDVEQEESIPELDVTLEEAEGIAEEVLETVEVEDSASLSEDDSAETELEQELQLDRPVVLSDIVDDEEDSGSEEEEDSTPVFDDDEEDDAEEEVEAYIDEAEESVEAGEPVARSLWLIPPIVLVGMLIRIYWYYKKPAMWLDEADVTSELLGRNFRELFAQLGESQCAPIGYLLTVKFTTLFGDGEYALRFYPLLATLLALVFVAWGARRMLEPMAAVMAVSIVAFSWPVIRYAAEFKQYGNDVMAAGLMLALGYVYLGQAMNKKQVAIFAVVGAVIQWFSLPVLFVLASVGLTLGVNAFFAKEWGKVKGLLFVGVTWLISFGLNYFISLKHYAADDTLRNWHHEAYFLYPPDPPGRTWIAAIKWLGVTFTEVFVNPLGILLPGLGIFAFVLGVVVLAKKHRALCSMIVLPIVGVFLAAALQRYPFTGRFLQFLVPSLAICCGVGLSETVQWLGKSRRSIAVFFVALIFVPSIAIIGNKMIKDADQGLRPAVAYWQKEASVDDSVYIDHWVRNEFKYYTRDIEDLDARAIQVGISTRNDWSKYETAMHEFSGEPRVWFFLQEHDWHLSIGERKFFETRLNASGKQLDYKFWGNYHLYLYDLSELGAESPRPKVYIPKDTKANPDESIGQESSPVVSSEEDEK